MKRMGAFTYSMREHRNEAIKYKATSMLTEFIPELAVDRDRYLRLPKNFSARIAGLVTELTAGKSEEDRLKTLLQYIQRGGYKYTLDSLPASETPLEDFLFVNKRGNCEYFASAFAVMLRETGIPARLVGGYRGGYYNAAGGYYMVLQKNAHVWVESYIADRGWLRLDPTPSPRRVCSKVTKELPPQSEAPLRHVQLLLVEGRHRLRLRPPVAHDTESPGKLQKTGPAAGIAQTRRERVPSPVRLPSRALRAFVYVHPEPPEPGATASRPVSEEDERRGYEKKPSRASRNSSPG